MQGRNAGSLVLLLAVVLLLLDGCWNDKKIT